MNILQVMASNKLGGAERFFCRLALALQQQAVQQTVMLRNDSPYVNELQANIPCFQAPFSGTFDFQSKRKLKSLLKEQQPQIVLSWMNRASGLVSQLYKTKNYQHIARLGGYYNLKYYQHCDHFIANTQGIADYLLQSGIPATSVHMISNFVCEQPGTPLKKPTNGPLIVALGRLHENKAFDTLIQAMTHVPEAMLWIGGTGPLHAQLSKQIDHLKLNDRVTLLGWVERPQDLIASADLFVCPSRHEPLGNVMLEAWAQHKPVVATRSQGALELITDNDTGVLSPLDDAPALAEAINIVLNDQLLANNLADNGLKRYQQQFSQHKITQAYLDLFVTML
ncbi:MAG: glycosyl transferase [Coxiella sp. (in: Bacteria)]|nr:MAG: glycosyl transferase [Coxiella sp. (in: g-proteobacteria)]